MPPKKHKPKPKKNKPKAAAASDTGSSPGSGGGSLDNTGSQHTGADKKEAYTPTTQEGAERRAVLKLTRRSTGYRQHKEKY